MKPYSGFHKTIEKKLKSFFKPQRNIGYKGNRIKISFLICAQGTTWRSYGALNFLK